jgi:hypothetical protein
MIASKVESHNVITDVSPARQWATTMMPGRVRYPPTLRNGLIAPSNKYVRISTDLALPEQIAMKLTTMKILKKFKNRKHKFLKFIFKFVGKQEMEFLDINLTKDSIIFCSMLFTVPFTDGF